MSLSPLHPPTILHASGRLARLRALVGLAVVLLSSLPTTGMAFSDDAVTVLPAAGTDSADVYSLTGTPNNLQARRVGTRRLLTDALGPAAFADLKRLPDGGTLLADVNDRGFATTTAEGELDFTLDASGARPGIQAASVIGYDQNSEPVRFLYADDNSQRVAIHDAAADTDIWKKRLVRPAAPAKVVQIIALPGERIAYAINWPTLGTSGIDVLDLSDENLGDTIAHFASQSHGGAPEETKIIDGLTGLRDLFGLDDDRLLVTGRERLFILSISQRKVLRRLDVSKRDDLAGQFVAARGLPSGRIAAATVEPGLWTRPHPNHRVIWFDDELSDLVARTEPLSRAPWRVEPADGHGASGSMGLQPDRSFVPTGELADIALDGPIRIRPVPARQGGTGSTTANISNPTARPVYLRRVAITASPGECEEGSDRTVFAESFDLVMRPSESMTIESAFALDPDAQTGEWCARLELEDRSGNARVESRDAAFSVIADGGDVRQRTGRRVEPLDLGLNSGDIGTGSPDGGSGPITDLPTDPVGCGCDAAGRRRLPVSLGLVALGLLGGALARRRR